MKDVLTFVGIDVSKARLDVALHPTGATHSVANDANGIKTLVEQLRAVKPLLVVLEATGGIKSCSTRLGCSRTAGDGDQSASGAGFCQGYRAVG